MPSQASSPDLPTKHSWTHRPKSLGGTDPTATHIEHEETSVAYQPNVDFKDTATVTWTVTEDAANQRVTMEAESAGGGGGGTLPIDLRNPSLGTFFAATSFSYALGVWQMNKQVAGSDIDTGVNGIVMATGSYSDLAVVLRVVAGGSSGDVRLQVSTYAFGDGDSPVSGLISETAQTVSVGSNMVEVRSPTTGGLASGPSASTPLIVVSIQRLGTDAADTMADPLVLFGAWLEVNP